MKISKVEHTRAAVSVDSHAKEPIGILYNDPIKKKEGILNVEKRFKKLSNNAKRLYNFFNTVQVGEEPTAPDDHSSELKKENYPIQKDNYDMRKKAERLISGKRNGKRGGINADLRNCFFDSYKGEIKSVDDVIYNIGICSALNEEEKASLDNCLSVYLRRSLRDQRDNIRIVIRAFGNKNLTEDEKKAVENLVEAVVRDYSKADRASHIRKSIENQNLVIQTTKGNAFAISTVKETGKKSDNRDKDGKIVKEGPTKGRKNNEKVALDSFLTQYADLDSKKRKEYLCRLRNLLDAYFCYAENPKEWDLCIEIVDRKTDYDVWKRHEKGKENEGWFVEIPEIVSRGADGKHKQNKVELNKAIAELENSIRSKNMACYRYVRDCSERYSSLFFDDQWINRYWIHHFENAVERILNSIKPEKVYRLKIGVLREKVWKDALNLLSVKYIALGKEIFHFGMQNLFSEDINDMKLGEFPDEVKKGISSFDYEIIKANETLQREVAVAVAFAANNLSRATVSMEKALNKAKDDMERYNRDIVEKHINKRLKDKPDDKSDILLWNESYFKECRKKEDQGATLKAILQFFGGESVWDTENDSDNLKKILKEKYNDKYEIKFLNDLKELLYALRNESFHFTTIKTDHVKWNSDIIGRMFEKDAQNSVSYERDKFYSNNLPMFYSNNDLRKLLDVLYSKISNRASQIPSFNRVFVRSNFRDYLKNEIGITGIWNNTNYSIDVLDKWESAVYYVFKEIYYNAFISDEIKEYFDKALRKEYKSFFFDENVPETSRLNSYIRENNPEWKHTAIEKEVRSTADFLERYEELKNNSFSSICQAFATEYNYQNKGRKVKSTWDKRLKPDIFQHYKLLLNKVIAKAFASYIKARDDMNFITSPYDEPVEKCSEGDFLPDWISNKYEKIILDVKNKPELQKWYITGRFLSGKTLNKLVGSLRSYIQFYEDIERRAKETNNSVYIKHKDRGYLDNIIQVLEICIRLNNKYTNNINDYYDGNDEYADYLADYLDYSEMSGDSSLEKLLGFCNMLDDESRIYFDGRNPIPNRNVIMSKLFGPGDVLQQVITKIGTSDIDKLNKLTGDIGNYRKTKKCADWQEQGNVLEYQKLKNKIEFRDFVEFGEIINDLLGQLINWSYLRERDLLYFQLGFHYKCLRNHNCTEKTRGYDRLIDENGKKLQNAILYQIASMYIFGLGMFEKSGKSEQENVFSRTVNSTVAIGGKVPAFANCYSWDIYTAGLELFEVVNEHTQIIELRNTIDHFHYYNNDSGCGSILDLYSEVYDRFFSYDMKYQKNVANMLESILLRHHVIIVPQFATKENGKIVGENDSKKTKDMAKIDIAINGCDSDLFTFKIEGGDKTKDMPAKSREFLDTVVRILYYRDNTVELDRIVAGKECVDQGKKDEIVFSVNKEYIGSFVEVKGKKIKIKIEGKYYEVFKDKKIATLLKNHKKDDGTQIMVRFMGKDEEQKNKWEYVETVSGNMK